MDPIRNRIKSAINSLKTLCYSDRVIINEVRIKPGDYHFREVFSETAEMTGWRPFAPDETWGGRDMNHQDIVLTGAGNAGDVFELAFYAYSNSETQSNFFQLTAAAYEKNTAALYYDLKVPFEAADLLSAEDLERIETFKILNNCIGLLDFRKPDSCRFHQSVQEASAYIKKHYYDTRTGNPVTIHSIGHTHIDVAWIWQLKQTKQKAMRSFYTVLNLMDRYPEFRFMSSQPQLYEFVRQEAPLLFDRIREKLLRGAGKLKAACGWNRTVIWLQENP